jgi:hypothetical protein
MLSIRTSIGKIMSLPARREILSGVADAYNKAGKTEKARILDGFAYH